MLGLFENSGLRVRTPVHVLLQDRIFMEAAITYKTLLMQLVCMRCTEIVHFLMVLWVLSDKLDGFLRVFLVFGARLD